MEDSTSLQVDIETFEESLLSTPGLVQRTPLVYLILLMCNYSQTHRYPMNLFPKLNISIKHRQIGGQSMRFALHNRFWITVGCLLLWRKIRWFQQSKCWLKGSGSSDVWQVSVGPTRASRLDPSLDQIVGMLTLSCQHYWSHIQMRLNISVAKHLWKCVVSEAWSSLASWLQPRWVVEAPAQDQSLRLTRGNLPEQNPQHEVIWVCVADLRSFERGPQKDFIWKATAKSCLLSCFGGGRGGKNFPCFAVIS